MKSNWYQAHQLLPVINYQTVKQNFIDKATESLKKDIQRICFTSANNQDVQIIDTTTNQTIDLDTLTKAVQESIHSEKIDHDLNQQIKDIINQSLIYHTPNTWFVEEQMIAEIITKQKLPLPGFINSKQVVYKVNTDVAPAAKQLLTEIQKGTPDIDKNIEFYHASLSGFYKSANYDTDFLMVTFANDQAYQDFLQLIQPFASMNSGKEISEIASHLTRKIDFKDSFYQVLFLSKANPLESNSMLRFLQYQLATFERSQGNQMFITPLSIKQIYTPMNIILLNLEKMANTSIKDIERGFSKINNLKKDSIYLINNQKLLNMSDIQTTQQKQYGGTNDLGKASRLKLSNSIPKKPMQQKQLAKMIAKTFEKLTTNNISKNTYKMQQSTFMKPNRRNPDDINKAGTQNILKYRPDIHLFIDTSGSVSEENYKSTVLMLIQVAKKLDVDLYVNFFSTSLTQTTLLKVKNRDIKTIYNQFQSLPKVTGGTEYANVWTFINKIDTKLKTPRVYFMITDFEYNIYKYTKFTKTTPAYTKLYYIPLAIPQSTDAERYWGYMMDSAKLFMHQMIDAGATKIRSHLLI